MLEIIKVPPRIWGLRIAAILNISLAIVNLGLWLIALQQGLLWRADFTAFYTGWSIAWNGEGRQLYDLNLQTQYQQQILSEGSFSDQLLPFDYPPHAAWLFAPMALLPRPVAYGVWTILQIVLLLVLLRWLWLYTQSWQKSERWITIINLLAFTPLAFNFLLGSFSLLLLVCTLMFYQAIRQDRQIEGGVWLIVASLKPQSVLSLGFAALGARRWRLLFTSAGIGLALFAICGSTFGWSIWLDFLNIVGEVGRINGQYGIVPIDMYNLKGWLTYMAGADHFSTVAVISTVVFIAVMLLTAWMWRGPWRPSSPVFELRLAFTILLGMIFSLHFYPQDSLLLVAPALLFYSYLRNRGTAKQIFAVVITCFPLVFFISELFIAGEIGPRLPTLLMLGLTIWIGRLLWRESVEPTSTRAG